MSGTVTLVSGAVSVALTTPNFPYTSIIKMAVDQVRLDDGSFDSYDHGGTYDKRSCECEFDLTPTLTNSLLQMIGNTKRAVDFTMTLSSGSGFFPFGPDKGDAGSFTVAVELVSNSGIQYEPWQYHRIKLRIHNTGSYPAYSIPTEVNDGTSAFQIGTVTNLRYPPDRFSPDAVYETFATILEGSSSQWVDRGSAADSYSAAFHMVCNQTKCAKLIQYLVDTARGGNFTLVSDSNFYPFGRDIADGSHTVQSTKFTYEIMHDEFSHYEFDMEVRRVA